MPPQPLEQSASASQFDFIWVVWFIPNRATRTESRVFRFPSNEMPKVVARAKRHCDSQHARYIRVEPFLADLDKMDRTPTADYGPTIHDTPGPLTIPPAKP